MSQRPAHILVVSDPPAAPGYLPRLRYLCDYLVRQGYEVTLLTEQYEPLPFAHSYPIVTVPMYTGGTFDWFIKTVWTLLSDWHNRAFARKSLQLSAIRSQTFDLVLCTSFSDFPLGAAQRIAARYRIPLICDIRDLDEQVDDSRYQYRHQSRWLMPFRRLYRAIHIRRRNKVLRAADAVTTVSPWHADFIKAISRQPSAVSVVYNGYDAKQFYPEDIHTEQFTITYIGSLFEWQKPALEQVRKAIEDLDVVLELHTPKSNPVSYEQLGDAIRRSGIMLVLTDTRTHGMLTTKFYEALGCEKPVLCVPSDKGALAELIAYTNAGIATDDSEQIKEFILTQYKAWQQQGFTRQATHHNNEFSREAQCEQLKQILTTMLQ